MINRADSHPHKPVLLEETVSQLITKFLEDLNLKQKVFNNLSKSDN